MPTLLEIASGLARPTSSGEDVFPKGFASDAGIGSG
eukprot:CAMPEP_0115285830 /NCGR_PEP_ID=MMETSP0270-20121206/61632_1 /TAXON_ID=71861 /ORGANISM="Scrippsiella trochoidea, Strain CCMP3099" /LENGTH=35 /DNA_ID= /DNA_START= /DNA_END= /DNA_ORIENTATION=